MTHPHETLLRELDQAMLADDMEKFFTYYTDDVVVHITGRSSLAGVYKGKDQLQDVFGRFMQAAGEFTFEPHAYLADDEHGIILQRSKATKDGRTLETNDTFIFHFRDGKVSEFWMVTDDPYGMDAFLG